MSAHPDILVAADSLYCGLRLCGLRRPQTTKPIPAPILAEGLTTLCRGRELPSAFNADEPDRPNGDAHHHSADCARSWSPMVAQTAAIAASSGRARNSSRSHPNANWQRGAWVKARGALGWAVT